jgi:adenine-specific DNA-methyltransferase
MLVLGDNLQVLRTLLSYKQQGRLRNPDGTNGVRLCYIDPPFATRRSFAGRQNEQVFEDRVAGAEFVEFLRRRLILIRELLTPDGSLYLHLDSNKVHYMKVVLDEIFGANNLIAEIIWKRVSGHGDARRWSPVHQTILAYSRGPEYVWNKPREPLDAAYAASKYVHDDDDGRGRYRLDNLTSPNPRPKMTYVWQGYEPPEKGWRYSRSSMDELDEDRRIDKPDDESTSRTTRADGPSSSAISKRTRAMPSTTYGRTSRPSTLRQMSVAIPATRLRSRCHCWIG